MRLLPLPVAALLPALVACEPVAVVSFATPPLALDVDAERTRLEHALCAGSADACAVLTALDMSDDGVAAPTPAFPRDLPLTIAVAGAQGEHEVLPWLEEQRRVHELVPSLAVPFALAEAGVDAALLEGAELVDARVLVHDEGLTLALPRMWLRASDVDIGVVDADGVVSLASGGAAALLDAARDGAAVNIVPEDAPLALEPASASSVQRPGGRASFTLLVDVAVPLAVAARAAR